MTDDSDDIKSSPLAQMYVAARRVAGKQATYECMRAFCPSGLPEDVPSNKRDACLVALRKLANGGEAPKGSKSAVGLDDIRRQAYGDRRPAAPTHTLDVESIYSRWNSARVERD